MNGRENNKLHSFYCHCDYYYYYFHQQNYFIHSQSTDYVDVPMVYSRLQQKNGRMRRIELLFESSADMCWDFPNHFACHVCAENRATLPQNNNNNNQVLQPRE